jgi:4-alpha-glucanotransferase
VQRLGRARHPVGLYGDYAVGVNPSGSETWSDQSVYRMGAGVGAPPDPLALKGQDWGIPPQDPYALIAARFKPFRNLIAANMRHFGALRLDHVMALFRQWWVPVGLGSTEGGYVQPARPDVGPRTRVNGPAASSSARPRHRARQNARAVAERRLPLQGATTGKEGRRAAPPARAVCAARIATVTTHDLPSCAALEGAGPRAARPAAALSRR